jgi:hypothetical protein
MVVIDNTTLALLFHPGARPPKDPKTGQALVKARERIEQLITDLDAEDERMIIPTPVLSEFLILADREGPLYLEKIHGAKTLLVRPFDERAAIELAAMELTARGKGGKRAATDFGRFARSAGMKVVCTWDLPIPASKTPLFDRLDEETAADADMGDTKK